LKKKEEEEIIIIIIIIIIFITFMYSIYNYIPDTNHVSSVYSVAALVYLQILLHVMLLRTWNMFQCREVKQTTFICSGVKIIAVSIFLERNGAYPCVSLLTVPSDAHKLSHKAMCTWLRNQMKFYVLEISREDLNWKACLKGIVQNHGAVTVLRLEVGDLREGICFIEWFSFFQSTCILFESIEVFA
jgi:hypothetical protein